MADSDSDKPRGSIVLWALSAVFVLALLIGGGIVTVNALRDDAAPPPTTPPTAPPTTAPTAPTAGSTSSAPEAELACERPESGEVPQETPEGIEWKATDYGLLLPYSTTSGPSDPEVADPVAGCFEHSPTGALLALSHIVGPALLNPSKDARAEVIDSTFTATGREAAKEAVLAANNSPWQWRAFRVSSYSSDEAIITVIRSVDPGNYLFGTTFTLRWEDEAWKLDSEAALSSPTFTPSEADVAGYIPWRGQA